MSATQQLVQVHNNLEKLLKAKQAALPKGFNETRFLQNAMTVLSDVKDIEKMQVQSVARTMLKGAFLGLDFFNKECYAIPYGTSLQFQTDYKGEIKLAKKYSLRPIRDIYAKLVRQGDHFEEVIHHGVPAINYKPKAFNNGEIVGVFAVCIYQDGTMIYETMSVEEVEKIRRRFSKMPDGKAWKDSPGEMTKKTVLRRLTKLIEIEFDSQDAAVAYEEGGDAEFGTYVEVSDDKEPIKSPEALPVDVTNNTEATPVQIVTLKKTLQDNRDKLDAEAVKQLDSFLGQKDKSFDAAQEWLDYFKAEGHLK